MDSFHILHFSDLHFGRLSIKKDADLPEDFEDFFSNLTEKINDIIRDYSPQLILISGDIGSYGVIPKDNYLKKFFEIFAEKDIPILTCVGNHDLDRKKIKTKTQFRTYVALIKSLKNIMKVDLSKSFKKNQACYKYLENVNSLFISINSCVNIIARSMLKTGVMKFLNRFIKEEIYDYRLLNVGVFSTKQLRAVLKEIKTEFTKENYENMNKFILFHHPIFHLNRRRHTIDLLEENDIKLVFSGHSHHYGYFDNGRVRNFIAGSILVMGDQRKNFKPISETPPHFNQYEFNFKKKYIKQIIYLLKHTKGPWEKYIGQKIDFPLKARFLSYLERIESKPRFIEIANKKLIGLITDYLFIQELDSIDNVRKILEESLEVLPGDLDNLTTDQKIELLEYSLQKAETAEEREFDLPPTEFMDKIDELACNGLNALIQNVIDEFLNELEEIREQFSLDYKLMKADDNFGWTFHIDEKYPNEKITIYKYRNVENETNVDVYEIRFKGFKIFFEKYIDPN